MNLITAIKNTRIFKSLFGDDPGVNKNVFKKQAAKVDPAALKDEVKPTDLHIYPKSVAGKTTNPNMMHKDWHDHLKKYKGDFGNFKKDFNLGQLPQDFKYHLAHHFADKDQPSPDNNFGVDADEVFKEGYGKEKAKEQFKSGYKKYAERYVDLPKMENWFKDTSKKFHDHMKDNDIKHAHQVNMKGFDFKHKEHYNPEQLDLMRHALKEHKSALSVLMQIEDPGTIGSANRMKSHRVGGKFMENTELPAESNLYKSIIKPFLKSHSDINEGGYKMDDLQNWFNQYHQPQKANVKNKKKVFDTYSDSEGKNFTEATGKNVKNYEYQDYDDNPFSPDSVLHRYKHKAEGHNLYTKEYYDQEGNIGEAPEPPEEKGKRGSGVKQDLINEYLEKYGKKTAIPEQFEEDSKFSDKDFKDYPEGSKITNMPLDYLVSGHDKEKGTVDLVNPYTHDLIPILNKIATEMNRDPAHFNKDMDIAGAIKQLHQQLSPDMVHQEAAEGGNVKTIAEHEKDMQSQNGKYLTAKERELHKKVADTAKKHGVELGKGGPKEGIQRTLFESDEEFDNRFEKFKKENPLYEKESKAWEHVNAAKKELDDHQREHTRTPEHEKAVKSLVEDVFNSANKDDVVDADKYINIHKQVQKLGKALGKRPPKSASEEERAEFETRLRQYTEARDIMEAMHPAFTPEKLKDRKRALQDMHKHYSGLHRWALTRDKTTMPVSELKNRAGGDKLKAHSWEEISNMDYDTLKNAGVSPNIVRYVADMHPEVYSGNYDPGDLSNEQRYLEHYRLAKSHALHQVSGKHAPLNIQTIQNFGLSSAPLDKEQLRQRLGLKNDYEKKKLEHLLAHGVEKGLFEKKGKEYVLAPKQVKTVTRKSLKDILSGFGKGKDKKPEPMEESKPKEPSENWHEEEFSNSKPNLLGYDNHFHKNHIKNIIGNFRKDDTDREMKEFEEQLPEMDEAQLIEYRSQLKALKREFETELSIRSLDDNTKTPHSDPEFRDYSYMEDLVNKQLNVLSDYMLDHILSKEESAEPINAAEEK